MRVFSKAKNAVWANEMRKSNFNLTQKHSEVPVFYRCILFVSFSFAHAYAHIRRYFIWIDAFDNNHHILGSVWSFTCAYIQRERKAENLMYLHYNLMIHTAHKLWTYKQREAREEKIFNPVPKKENTTTGNDWKRRTCDIWQESEIHYHLLSKCCVLGWW